MSLCASWQSMHNTHTYTKTNTESNYLYAQYMHWTCGVLCMPALMSLWLYWLLVRMHWLVWSMFFANFMSTQLRVGRGVIFFGHLLCCLPNPVKEALPAFDVRRMSSVHNQIWSLTYERTFIWLPVDVPQQFVLSSIKCSSTAENWPPNALRHSLFFFLIFYGKLFWSWWPTTQPCIRYDQCCASYL